MSKDNIFGPIITGKHVRTATRSHIRKWFPTYLAEVAREDGRSTSAMPHFKSYSSAFDMPDGRFIEDAIPACIIVCPGWMDAPERRGGLWTVKWAVGLGAVVSGRNREETVELAELYVAALRACVGQHQSLGGLATACDPIGERYDDIPNDMSRTLVGGTVQFAVEIPATLMPGEGPDEPLEDPDTDPGRRATFDSVDSTISGRK